MLSDTYKQQMTYWAASGNDGFGGKAFSAPVLLMCRYELRQDIARNAVGEEVVARSRAWVPSDVVEGGYLALGDQTASADPTVVSGAEEIVAFIKIPDIKSMGYERRALCK